MTLPKDPAAVRFRQSHDGFAESKCGEWFIEPRHPGFVIRRKTEHGLSEGRWYPSQAKCKAHAQAVRMRERMQEVK